MEHNMFCKYLSHYRKDGKCYCDTEMRPAGLESIDPRIVSKIADLHDYEQAETNVRAVFSSFSENIIASIWRDCFGRRRFFLIDWWKFKLGLSGKKPDNT